MAQDCQKTVIDELNEVLDTEKAAVIQGDLEQIERIVPRKEFLIELVNGFGDIDRDMAIQLQDKVARNQLLLGGTMQGLRAVADRLTHLQRARHGLETYDQSGRKSRFETAVTSSVEKRA